MLNNNKLTFPKEKSQRKYSDNSNGTSLTNDGSISNGNIREKRHVLFENNFIEIIEVESWKKFNIDVSEKDGKWIKVESEKKANLENNNCIYKINHNEHLNKKEKYYCICSVF